MSMRAQWQALEKRFTALQLSERRLILCATVAVIGFVAYSLGVEPAQRQRNLGQKALNQQQTELNRLNTQIAALRNQLKDPDAANRAALAVSQSDVAKVEAELKVYDPLLVPPGRMATLLQSLLNRHAGLELVALKTLPVAPLLAPATAEAPRQAQPAAPAAKPVPPAPGGMYRHAMEITIAGAYPDLLAYAEELQRISPRPLWSAMRLKVVEYPRSELTFTLYTLSLDLPWLAL